jgi:hypothetical protein
MSNDISPSVHRDPCPTSVESGDVHGDVVIGLVSGVNRGLGPADDGGHQIDAGGEAKAAVVPLANGLFKECIEAGRVQGILECPDRQRPSGWGQ